jgi:hypothetical protein
MRKSELQAAYDVLSAEAAAMRAELAVHRSHACPAPAWPGQFTLTCTCGQTQGCAIHPWQMLNTWCQGGAGPAQTFTFNAGAGEPFVGTWLDTAGAAAQPQPFFTYTG